MSAQSKCHAHTHTHAHNYCIEKIWASRKIKYIFTLDENKMRNNSRNHKFSDLSPVHFFFLLWHHENQRMLLEPSSMLSKPIALLTNRKHIYTHARTHAYSTLFFLSKERKQEINECHGTTEAISTSWKCQCYRYIHNLRFRWQQRNGLVKRKKDEQKNEHINDEWYLFMFRVCVLFYDGI